MDHREVGCCDAPSSYYPHTPHTTARLGKIAVQHSNSRTKNTRKSHGITTRLKKKPGKPSARPVRHMGHLHLAKPPKSCKKKKTGPVSGGREISLLPRERHRRLAKPTTVVGFIGISLRSCRAPPPQSRTPHPPPKWPPPPPRDPSSDPAPPRRSAVRRPEPPRVRGRLRCRGGCPPLPPASS